MPGAAAGRRSGLPPRGGWGAAPAVRAMTTAGGARRRNAGGEAAGSTATALRGGGVEGVEVRQWEGNDSLGGSVVSRFKSRF